MSERPEPLHGEVAALIIADDQYLFRHTDKGQQVLKFISRGAVRAAFNHEPLDSAWLPDGIRRWGVTPAGHFALLSLPAQRHELVLMGEPAVFGLDDKLVRLQVPLPPLVFAGLGTSYWLWALAGEFDPGARLYHAPLPNVHLDAQVCWGTNAPPGADQIARAWRLFCAAPFNADLTSGKSKAYPNDVRLKLRDLAPRRAYPRRDLVPYNQTVEQSFSALMRKTS